MSINTTSTAPAPVEKRVPPMGAGASVRVPLTRGTFSRSFQEVEPFLSERGLRRPEIRRLPRIDG